MIKQRFRDGLTYLFRILTSKESFIEATPGQNHPHYVKYMILNIGNVIEQLNRIILEWINAISRL